MSLTALILVLAFYFIIKIRERKQKLLQEYLERELVARTKEVVEQKEMIEIKEPVVLQTVSTMQNAYKPVCSAC